MEGVRIYCIVRVKQARHQRQKLPDLRVVSHRLARLLVVSKEVRLWVDVPSLDMKQESEFTGRRHHRTGQAFLALSLDWFSCVRLQQTIPSLVMNRENTDVYSTAVVLRSASAPLETPCVCRTWPFLILLYSNKGRKTTEAKVYRT